VVDRAGLGKFLIAAFERGRYTAHGERDIHAAHSERVHSAVGPRGVRATSGPGRPPTLDPGGFGAAAGADRARRGIRLVTRRTGPPAQLLVVGGPVPLERLCGCW
jgi:hypothetical protein